MMKTLAILAVLFVAALAADDYCYNDITGACRKPRNKQDLAKLVDCNSKYGAIEHVMTEMQMYANTHIMRSFEYLLMSTHYSNYEKNREGFEKLFRDLSDEKWNAAIDIIKHITKRGGEMNFKARKPVVNITANDFELYELESLAKAVDIEKDLATDAHKIHDHASNKNKNYHDPEITSYVEEEFVHKQAHNVRKLSGYTNDLLKIMDGPDRSLGLFFMDEYLLKH